MKKKAVRWGTVLVMSVAAGASAASQNDLPIEEVPACVREYVLKEMQKIESLSWLFAAAEILNSGNTAGTTSSGVAQTGSPQGDLIGHARVIDGDTVDLDGTRIRLLGVDAPEKSQKCTIDGQRVSCGEMSTAHLKMIIGDRPLQCDAKDKDRYGRTVATCWAGEVDISAQLIRDGWALAYRNYSKAYIPLEDEARMEGIGMWAGEFQNPADYRKGQRG